MQSSQEKRDAFWVSAVGHGLVICVACPGVLTAVLLPTLESPPINPLPDELRHVFGFAAGVVGGAFLLPLTIPFAVLGAWLHIYGFGEWHNRSRAFRAGAWFCLAFLACVICSTGMSTGAQPAALIFASLLAALPPAALTWLLSRPSAST